MLYFQAEANVSNRPKLDGRGLVRMGRFSLDSRTRTKKIDQSRRVGNLPVSIGSLSNVEQIAAVARTWPDGRRSQ